MTYSTVELTGATKKVSFPAIVQYGGQNPSDLDQLPGNSRIWIDLEERARVWVLRNSYFNSEQNYRTGMEILEDDETITFRVRNGAGGYNHYNGKNNDWVVGWRKTAEAEQMDYLGEKWKVPQITLVEAE